MAYSSNPYGASLLQLQANTCPCVQGLFEQLAGVKAFAAVPGLGHDGAPAFEALARGWFDTYV